GVAGARDPRGGSHRGLLGGRSPARGRPPRRERRVNADPEAVLLDVRHLTVHYPVRKGLFGRATGQVHAADDVSFRIAKGETLGLVGESGCGMSSTAKAILKLVDPTSGEIAWRGQRI